MRARRALASGLLAGGIGLGWLAEDGRATDGAAEATAPARNAPPRLELGEGAEGIAFVDDATCHACHEGQASAWRGSHHDLAMQVASEQSVLGNFDDARHDQDGREWRFFRRDGRYLVSAEGADGARADHVVEYTFGVHPLQQYLVAAPGGRLQALPAAWDTARGRWFDLYPEERTRPGDAFHWTGRYQTWNAMCAECHSTNLEKRYDADADTYRTTWSAIDVGCQACHGPGAAHVEWARRGTRGGDSGAGLVRPHAADAAVAEVESCARCHARRGRASAEDRHGRALLDDFVPRTLDEGLYHVDGQILDEVYVYGSFVQSRMFAAGVRCSDCHEPHGLALRAEGNALCVRCHGPEPERALPGLVPGRYDDSAHHHHPPGSPGAQCVACHMPARAYMVVDPRRDHSFRVPRPDLTEKLGAPNACSGCHDDQSAAWAAARVRDWFGDERTRGADWAAAIHDGRKRDPGAVPALSALVASGEPAIVRATAASLLAGSGPAGVEALRRALEDPDPLVRTNAVNALATLPPPQRLPLLLPLLEDPVRAVRVATAQALAIVPDTVLEGAARRALHDALAEHEAAQRAAADLPTGRLNLAILYGDRGRLPEAEAAYRAAIDQDPLFMPPVANLAQLLSAQGRRADAESVLRAAAARMPDEGELHYSLGLLLAEDGRMAEAARSLERAAVLMPDRARVQYNFGLAMQHLGRARRASSALERAAQLDPAEPAYALALAIHYLQSGRIDDARTQAHRLAALAPGDPQARTLLAEIDRRSGEASGRGR